MEYSDWNCFVLEVFLQREINMWFINQCYFILRDKFLLPFLVEHVDKVYILSLLKLESTWLNMELAQAWVDSEAGLIQMLTVTGILIAVKIWKSILVICGQILTNSWNQWCRTVRTRENSVPGSVVLIHHSFYLLPGIADLICHSAGRELLLCFDF